MLIAAPRFRLMARRWQVLLVTSVGVFMTFLDVTIVNIAFPDIRASFPDSSLASLSWILNAYAIVFAAALVPAGRLADRFGRRRRGWRPHGPVRIRRGPPRLQEGHRALPPHHLASTAESKSFAVHDLTIAPRDRVLTTNSPQGPLPGGPWTTETGCSSHGASRTRTGDLLGAIAAQRGLRGNQWDG
jgi:hypothetical protein